jgi:hypothetical protein
VTWIRAVLDRIPILGARQLLETILDVLVLPACQSAIARAEIVDFCPTLFRLPGWHRSDGVVDLVRHPVQQLPHNPVVLKIPWLLEQTGTAHSLEVFQQLSSPCLITWNLWNYFPDLNLTRNLTTLPPLVPRHGGSHPLHSHIAFMN